MIAGFSSTGIDRTPAAHAPTATKLMCPNESTPGVADEDVERDDDRHVDERGDHVGLGRRRDERADQCGDEHERDRRNDL